MAAHVFADIEVHERTAAAIWSGAVPAEILERPLREPRGRTASSRLVLIEGYDP